jgi:hypothetical protein
MKPVDSHPNNHSHIRMRKVKLFTAALCIIGIGWLIISPKTFDRKEELNKSLKDHRFGILPDSVSKKLNKILFVYKEHLNITEDICLNCPVDSLRKLRFYTCDPSQVKITRCAAGNAIFDPQLNAVFIDNSLVTADEWVAKGTFGADHKNLPFLEVYLKFVLLHELGHYFLHSKETSLFDAFTPRSSAVLRRYESEADSFAVNRFTSIIEKDTSGTIFNNEIFGNLGMEIEPNITGPDKTLMCLALMGRNINLGMLFGVSPYSEFYSDQAHPTFISRSIGFLSGALQMAPVQDKFYAKAELVKSRLEQIQSIASKHSLTELKMDEPILNMEFDRSGILVQSLDSNLYHGDYNKIAPGDPGDVTEYTLEKMASNKVYFDLDKLYTFQSGEVFSANDGQILRLKKMRWRGINNFDSLDTFDKVPLQSQPADSIIYLEKFYNSYVVTADRLLQTIKHNEIEERVRSIMANVNIEILWNEISVIEPYGYLMLTEKSGLTRKLSGVIVIDLPGNKIKEVVKLNLADSSLSMVANYFDEHKSRIIYNKEDRHFYLFSSQTGEPADNRMELWKLSADGKPIFISKRSFLNGASASKTLLEIELRLDARSLAYLSAAKYIFNWNDDMIYLVDLTAGSIEPVFHFGASTIRIRTSKNGMLAIFSPLAYKFYIMKP